tara:strand:+ start:2950 stop:3429 length:480 start_codon:yes stop_codon:yes gene_type:complete
MMFLGHLTSMYLSLQNGSVEQMMSKDIEREVSREEKRKSLYKGSAVPHGSKDTSDTIDDMKKENENSQLKVDQYDAVTSDEEYVEDSEVMKILEELHNSATSPSLSSSRRRPPPPPLPSIKVSGGGQGETCNDDGEKQKATLISFSPSAKGQSMFPSAN